MMRHILTTAVWALVSAILPGAVGEAGPKNRPSCFSATGVLLVSNHVSLAVGTTQVQRITFSLQRRGDHWRLDATNSLQKTNLRELLAELAPHADLSRLPVADPAPSETEWAFSWITGSYEGTDVTTIARKAPAAQGDPPRLQFTQRQASVIDGGIPTFDPDMRLLWQAYLMPSQQVSVTNLPPPWPSFGPDHMRVNASFDSGMAGLPISITYHREVDGNRRKVGEYSVLATQEYSGVWIPSEFSLTQWSAKDPVSIVRETWGRVTHIGECGTNALTPKIASGVPTLDYRFADESKAIVDIIYTNTSFIPRDNPELVAAVNERIANTRFGRRSGQEHRQAWQIAFGVAILLALLFPVVLLTRGVRPRCGRVSKTHKT